MGLQDTHVPDPGISAFGLSALSFNPFTEVVVVVYSLSHVRLFVTPGTAACQAPLSMGLSRQDYWSGLPFLPPGDLPDPGIEPTSPESPALQADSLPRAPPLPHKVID